MASLQKQLNRIEKQLQGRMRNAMKDVAKEVKKIQSEQVEKVVYNSYNPKIYERRYDNGGLSDTNNMQHDITQIGDSVFLEILNTTMSNKSFLPVGKSPFYIAGVISQGDGYKGDIFDYPSDGRFTESRDFIQSTRNELVSNKAHILTLKKSLQQQGLKIK